MKKTLILSLLLLSSLPLAKAEETKVDKSKDKEDAIEVVVTASRGTEQDPLDVPQSISKVEREDFEDGAYADVDDVLRKLPGIGLAPSEGNANYWQEGFTIRALGAQRVLTLTDGVRQAGQGIGYGGGNLSLYDTFSIENIEVLRGPGSVAYGTDAFGGVINITTRNPKRRTEEGYNGGVRYEYDGARDLNRGGAYVDFGDENYGAVFGGSYTDAGNPNLPDGETEDSGAFKNFGLWGKFDYFVDDKTKVRVIGNYDRNSDVNVIDSTITLPIALFPPPGSSAPITSPLFFEFPEYTRQMAGIEYSKEDLSDTWEFFQTGIYYQGLRRDFHRETAYYPSGSPGFAGPPLFVDPTASVTTAVVDTEDEVDTFEWQTQSRHRFNDHTVTFGLDVGYDVSDLPETETLTSVATAGIGALVGTPMTTQRNRADASQVRVGIYAQDSWNISDQWEVTPGIRFDSFKIEDDISDFDDDEFGVSGSLGAVYRPDDQHSYYANVATGFRVPDLGERFQTGIVNLGVPSQIIGKEDLDSERAYTAEIGTKGRLENASYEAALYASHIKNYIGLMSLGFVDGFATDQYDNLGDVTLYGGEAATTFQITEKLEAYGNVSRTFTDDDDKIDVYNWVFNYGVKHTEPVASELVEDVSAALNFRSVLESEDKTPSASRDPFDDGSFTVVDLVLEVTLRAGETGKASIVGGISNLFDKNYQEPFFNKAQPARAGFVGVQYTF